MTASPDVFLHQPERFGKVALTHAIGFDHQRAVFAPNLVTVLWSLLGVFDGHRMPNQSDPGLRW